MNLIVNIMHSLFGITFVLFLLKLSVGKGLSIYLILQFVTLVVIPPHMAAEVISMQV
jgi:hypothetical protein